MATILVTGGTGYIGSHTVVELQNAGHSVVIVDNLSASDARVVDRIAAITGSRPALEVVDLREAHELAGVFDRHGIDVVIHFAAMKAVGESTEIPLHYLDNNVGGTTSLLRVMREAGVTRMVFSSSCSVYGETTGGLLDEQRPTAPTNPYAWSKWAGEQMLEQACRFDPEFRAIALRYFNPIGAHPSALIGEVPTARPRNIAPLLTAVAAGVRPDVEVFGTDYPTPDGTAVRDYVHVVDVARGHVDALDHLDDSEELRILNLGTGRGTSVLDLIRAFEAASGREIPHRLGARRLGDVAELVAGTTLVSRLWGWQAELDLARMCADTWAFHQRNPQGYAAAVAAEGDNG